MYEWDEVKRAINLANHGIDFAAVEAFDFTTAVIRIDSRQNYGETRETAVGFIGERLHVLVFTRRGTNCRVISLRKANAREVKRYVREAPDA